MTSTTTAPSDAARAASRRFGAYARPYAAGAFATPTAAELDDVIAAGGYRTWPGAAAVARILTRPSARRDFTGRRYRLPAGSSVISHLALNTGAELPDLDAFDWIYAYPEDHALTAQLIAQGREVRAVSISAASEIKTCWGRKGTGYPYPPVDAATLVEIPVGVEAETRAAITEEVIGVHAWHDDFPFYSDGSWDAVSLRGFNPADATWGIKPAEMPRSWHDEHPEAAQYTRCDWTVLAGRMPATTRLAARFSDYGELERVRLLRMAGRGGRGGSLARHCDITDRAAGTQNGQVIRLHIPIITHRAVTMSAWNLRGERTEVHLPAWSLWYLDARKPHAVDNRAGIDRVHLVIDIKATQAARDLLAFGKDWAA
jgi:hypothetical protein